LYDRNQPIAGAKRDNPERDKDELDNLVSIDESKAPLSGVAA